MHLTMSPRTRKLPLRNAHHSPSTMKILNETGAIALAESLPDAFLLVDGTGKIRYANAIWEDFVGYQPIDLIGQHVLDLVAPGDRQSTMREAARVLAGNKRTGFQNRYLHRDGAAVQLSWSAQWRHIHQLRIGVAREVVVPSIPAVPASEQAMHARKIEGLARHERRVLDLLLTEAAEKQIAERLGLAVSTTHSYITTIYRKFGVRGRAGLMSLWLRHTPLQEGRDY